MNKALLLIAATITLDACGSHDAVTADGAGKTTVTRPDGQGGTMTAQTSGTDTTPIPGDLPTWAPAFPGAKVAQVMVQNDKSTATKAVVLTTSQDMRSVVDFYNKKIASAGLTPTMAQDAPDGSMRVIEDASGAKNVLMIGRSDDMTSITVSYSLKH